MIILSTSNPMLSSKLNVLSHYSIPSGHIWKIHLQSGVIFSRWSFGVPTTPCYLQNWIFCLITQSQVLRIEKFIHKEGSFFPDDDFEYQQPTLYYLQKWIFHPMFQFISILFALCLIKPYYLLFKCNFDSLEWQFETYCFYVDLETSSKIKLICFPTHYYWLIPFSAVNSIF